MEFMICKSGTNHNNQMIITLMTIAPKIGASSSFGVRLTVMSGTSPSLFFGDTCQPSESSFGLASLGDESSILSPDPIIWSSPIISGLLMPSVKGQYSGKI